MGDPVNLKETLKDPEHNNWLKAVLILRELKVGISSFVEVRCREAQEDVLRTVLKYLPPNVTAVPQCTTCTSTSLQRNRACPQNVCTFILQEINTIHRNRLIQLSCTDISAWTDTSRCWEFAKTFIMGKGYGDKRSAADTDCTGLLSIIINCVWIHKYLTENMGRNHTVFHEVKNLRNEVMHSPDNRLSHTRLHDLIKACVQILADSKILVADQTAIAARERIKEIEAMLLTVSNVDYPSVFLEVEEHLKQDISDLAGKHASQAKDISDIAGKQTSQAKDMSNLAGKQTSQAKDISNIAGKQTSQEQNISYIAGKQASQAKDISDIVGKQTSQAKDISDIAGKQTSQEKNISDIAGKHTSQEKNISDIAGKQTSQEKDISDIAGKQTSQAKDISDLARQQALQGNELQVKRKSEEGGQWKAKQRRMVAEKEAVKRKRVEEGQWKAERRRMGAEEEAGAAKLKEDILKGYQEDFDTVFETQLTDGVSAIHMFSPIIFREDLENQLSDNSPVSQMPSAAASRISHHSGKVEQIQSYRDIFFKDGLLQTLVVLLGEAGVGKTTFCNHIVNLWCLVQTEDCQRDFTENDQALINVLTQFEYLFVVRCRDTNEHISVLSMIKGMFCSKKDDIHIDNIFRYNTEQCLVIIDGLDEWMYTSSVERGKNSPDVLPDCTKIRGATVIMTSRPWKVEALPRKSLRSCRVLQIEGLDRKGIENLTHKFIEALRPSVTDHETLCESFLREVDQQEMGDIVKQPLLLRSIIESWLSRNHKLHRSLTMNYAGLINSVVSHSCDKLSDKDKTLAEHQEKESLPGCFKEMKTCLTHSGIIRKISALAFKTLVLKEKERSLVFSKKDLLDEVGEDCLYLCLKLGILSETKASSLARVKHVTLSFIHKSVQECFVAVHLSEDKAGRCLTEFTSKLNSHKEVLDLELILIFLFGMSPSKGQTVLNHVYGVVDQCSEIKAYRQCADCELAGIALAPVKVCRLLNQLYIRCAVELKHTASSPTGQHTPSETNLYIPDVLIDENQRTPPADVVHLLFCPGEHIKSLKYIGQSIDCFFTLMKYSNPDYVVKPPLYSDVVESLESMNNIEKLVVLLSQYHLNKGVDLIIQSLPNLQQLQSFKLGVSFMRSIFNTPRSERYKLSVVQTTSLFTELGKLTNLVSVALSCLDLTTVEKVEFQNNLNSVYLSDMIVTSDLLACLLSSCTTVKIEFLSCTGDMVFPSTCATLDCSNMSCTGDLVFPSICTTLNCTYVSCTGDLVFPTTCTTLNCSNVSYTGDLVLPTTCNTLNCSNVSYTGDLVLPTTCTTLNCSYVSYTGDLVFPTTCTTLICKKVSCTGDLVFPRVCTKLILALMSLRDLSGLPDSLTSLDMNDVTLTQSAGEQLCRGIQSTSTLQRLRVCGSNEQNLYLHGHLDLSSSLSLYTLELVWIVLDSCGVVVPKNVRKISMFSVTLSEEYWDELVENIYTCPNVRVSLMGVTINQATLKYIRQHFIVTNECVLPNRTDEKNDRTYEKKDRTDKKNNITDEEKDRTDETNHITDETNDRTDEKKNDKTDEKENNITDEEENNRTVEENVFTTATIEFITNCPENKFTIH